MPATKLALAMSKQESGAHQSPVKIIDKHDFIFDTFIGKQTSFIVREDNGEEHSRLENQPLAVA